MFHNKEYVYEVYKEMSFSKAAKKLYVTQPCLSAIIKKIENELGIQIFNRSVNPIQLTDEGKVYISYVIKVKKLEEEFESYLGDIRGLKVGRIAIGANNVCSSFVLPEIIKKFSDEYPEIEIELHEGNKNYLDDKMKDGTLDVILDNYEIDDKLFNRDKLFDENILAAIPQRYASKIENDTGVKGFSGDDVVKGKHLRKKGMKISFDILKDMPFIVLRQGNGTRVIYDNLCEQWNISPKIIFEVDQLNTAYNIACSNIGVTLVSDTLIQKKSTSSNLLRYYSLNSNLTKRELFFHYPKSIYTKLAVKRFIEEAVKGYE